MKWMFIISLIPSILLLVIKVKKGFHMLQQNWYNDGKRYDKWMIRNVNRIFLNLEVLFPLVYLLGFITTYRMVIYFYAFLYAILFYIIMQEFKHEQLKKPLVFTKRIIRLTITLSVLYIVPIFFIIRYYNEVYIPYYYLIISLLIYLVYGIINIANTINKPVEKLVYKYYYRLAQKKLKDMKNMDVIGITGSYGKTSSKNILYDILNVKYVTFKTPLNFNTPYGLCNSVNNYLDKFSRYFIAEMGAVKVHQIKDCCDLMKPKYGIITCIGQAHLESFGSQKNIINTKFELIESLPSDGLGILNGDDKLSMSYKIKNNCMIKTIGIDNQDVDLYADNIKLSYRGTTFDCHFKDDKKTYTFETCLLGKANVYNILTSILLGRHLGIGMDKLEYAVKSVRSIEHRLELKRNGNINIIDDAYNSNPVGSKMAVEVLGMMPGKRIIVTPGMIELGELQYEANKKFGTYMVNNCDEVILIGERQTKPIYDGLIEKKYNKEKIHVLNDVKLAFQLINELKEKDRDTYVLLENDLPDVFNE